MTLNPDPCLQDFIENFHIENGFEFSNIVECNPCLSVNAPISELSSPGALAGGQTGVHMGQKSQTNLNGEFLIKCKDVKGKKDSRKKNAVKKKVRIFYRLMRKKEN